MIDGTNYSYRYKTQLAIVASYRRMPASAKASKANKQRGRTNEYSSSASKAEFNIIQLVTELINRRKQLYVRTQLAIAIERARKMSEVTGPYVRTYVRT